MNNTADADDGRDPAPAPRANALLLGHDRAAATLAEAAASGRLPHAWLFEGPRGIGKATLAFRFARHLLAHGSTCPGPSSPPPESEAAALYVDPAHPIFQRIAGSGHADLITVERRINEKTGRLRTEIVVDDVRAVGAFFAHTPAEGGWRVAVVDGADEMNRNAANSLLKVLEEPPARSLLILVTHNAGRLLPTIRSRCRRLVLRPLNDAVMTSLLTRYRPDLPADQVRTAIALADGSIGHALGLARGGLGVDATLSALMARLPHLDVVSLGAFADTLARPGAEAAFATAMELFRRALARIVRCAAHADAAPQTAGGGLGEAFVERLAGAASLDRWLEVWEKTDALLMRTDSANLDRKQVVLTLFVTLRKALHT